MNLGVKVEILERPNGSRYGFASLANIGYNTIYL